jgi:Holliday junction DNA helicase RuvA
MNASLRNWSQRLAVETSNGFAKPKASVNAQAERLAVDLRTPIAAFGGLDPQPSLVEGLASEQIPEAGEDVEATLISLGYDELEIRRAIRAIADGASGVPPSGTDQDGWLRSCLQWLSRESA